MKTISRRKFIYGTTSLAAGAILLPGIASCTNARGNNTEQVKKTGKLNIAVIGVGGQGRGNLRDCTEENVVALCDVSETAAAASIKEFPNAKVFKDFRVMFDKAGKEIDAVIVCTPDHTHFAAAMTAMQLGKHICVEKPLAHNIWQLRTLRKAAKHYNVISQMANQGHATVGIRYVKEWYEAGILGDVKEVFAWFDGPSFNPKGYFLKPDTYPPKGEPVPEGLDWDLWLGPVAERPYSPYYIPRFWRGWYELGNGELGDWACHTLDAPFWALDLGMPVSVDSVFKTPGTPAGYVCDQSHLRFQFKARGNKPPVTLNWYEGGLKPENRPEWGLPELPGQGMIMVGDEISLMTGGRPNDPKLLVPEEQWNAFTQNMPAETIPRVEGGPRKEWIRAIKGEGPMPGSEFEYSARLTEMASLGVLAQRFDTRIEYDEDQMKVTNHPDYDVYIKEPVRKGWSYGENLW
ncbi:MAG: Gfo/Idh/MocA family oxidoreductase [Bacteroidales bacterium]|jgi:predicted dehydrogenase|nr:Gfo/Idh/MocA family oxidoreductase [Bacteroidales bacterium]